jgi:chemotaxis protein methyltransferase CheR
MRDTAQGYEISDHEFAQFQRFIFDAAGITMSDGKKALVSGRLARRLQHYGMQSYAEYLRLLSGGREPQEKQLAIDLLTTNETYFFREPRHFELLGKEAREHATCGDVFRVWSAASSSGEEAYSAAMVLDDALHGKPWEIVASDISMRVLQRAATGHYQAERTQHIPPAFLKRYCLRGIERQQGTLLVTKALRSRVQFHQVNLNETLPDVGQFDVIFLRNVMIYFSGDTKRDVVARVLRQLKPGGLFLIGHSESLNDISSSVRMVSPSIYRKL